MFAPDIKAVIDAALEVNRAWRAQRTAKGDAEGTILWAQSRLRYALDYCTVGVRTGRFTGQTVGAIAAMQPGDAMVVFSPKVADALRSVTRLRRGLVIYGPDDLIEDNVGSHPRIFIDEPTAVFDAVPLSTVYGALLFNKDQTFIQVGA